MLKRNVLVCGATGFIGRNVIDRLAAREDLAVYGTYFTRQPPEALRAAGRVSLVRADLTAKDEVDELLRGMDVVIQAAAVTTGSKDVVTRPWIHVTDNAVMNSLLLRACHEHRVGHLVFFSCTTMYPELDRAVREDDFNHQILDKYFAVGWTKVYIEKMCEFYSRIGSGKYTVIRHSNIYGPYDKYDLERSHVFGATVTKVMESRDGKVVVWGDGSEERDLLYVSDLVDFVECVMSAREDRFELINVGYGSSISVRNLVEEIIRASGKGLAVEFDTRKPSISFKLALNIDRATRKYGWRPKVSLEEGIRRTLLWYAEHRDEVVAAPPMEARGRR